ncbi:hypothetical protein THAOC_32531 [Thalassiosira oceanica]|uniref:Uncharacterized protein n=1 Tax=Thalassiosira oceanica TaxID=159749 RepID=K0R927_THAOC|nr:hypothetical protein THAOC_32531 [Thalassiosira oceanica]|eukprot:EJK48654.1 hypothetical protein THAOC_32531 [Thalassiosira oceanica]
MFDLMGVDSELRVSDRQPKDGGDWPSSSRGILLLTLLLCSSLLWEQHGCQEPVAPAPSRGPPAVHRDPVRADPGDRRLDLARADLQGVPRPGDGPAAPEPASRARLPPPAHEAAVPPHPAGGGVRRDNAGGQAAGAREEAPPQGAAVARRGGGRGRRRDSERRGAAEGGEEDPRPAAQGVAREGGQGGVGGGERRGGRGGRRASSRRAEVLARRQGRSVRGRIQPGGGGRRSPPCDERKEASCRKEEESCQRRRRWRRRGHIGPQQRESQDSREAAREGFQSQLEGFHIEGEGKGGENDWETSAAVQATISESIRQQQELHGGTHAAAPSPDRLRSADDGEIAGLAREARNAWIEDAQRRRRIASRRECIGAAADPSGYSAAQLRNFLEGSRLNARVGRIGKLAERMREEEAGEGYKAGDGTEEGRPLKRLRAGECNPVRA